jgi:hypothetical protein
MNGELVHFKLERIPELYKSKLSYPNQWYVGSKSGCSCNFRHLYSVELGFGTPEDWHEDGQQEIEATVTVIKIIREMVREGYNVDCVDIWEGTAPEEINLKLVDLGEVADEQFWFFENHHFLFEGSVD